jgi:uncharacterized protein YegP (UPF0339 family)
MVPHSYVEVYRGRDGSWRWRLKSRNHRVIGVGEGYTRRTDAVRGARRAAPDATVRVLTTVSRRSR